MKHLSLITNNSYEKVSYSQIRVILDYGYESHNDTYNIWCRDFYDKAIHFSFTTETKMWETLDKIRECILQHDSKVKQIGLVVSNPETWLDLAKKRAADGIAATKKHRDRKHREILRTLKR